MFKALVKKSRENKGFSLIELIVVIAILAILALILIPRFTGFTNDAREAADNATSRTIETAVMSLLASGDLEGNGDITITCDANNNTSSISFRTGLRGNVSDLEAMIGTDIRCETGNGFTVNVPTSGAVKCEVIPK